MATLSYNGESFTVDHAVKGADYIHGYDANGVLVVSFEGVADFSRFTYTSTYMTPGDCLAELCNDMVYCGGKAKTRGGADVPASAFGLTDYVIANGTSGAWSYWKFNSGLCVAMGKPTVSWGTMTEVAGGQSRSVTALDLTGIFTAVMGGTCSNAHRYANFFVHPSGGTSAELWATTAVAVGTMNISNFSTTPMVVLFGKWK